MPPLSISYTTMIDQVPADISQSARTCNGEAPRLRYNVTLTKPLLPPGSAARMYPNSRTHHEPREVTIDNARFRDISAVATIQRDAFRPGLAYSRFALFVLWALPAATFLVAKDAHSGEVVGNLITDRHRGNTRIVNIAVARHARRQGVGRQLLRELYERCPDEDIVLSVEASNTSAQRLYEDEGFVRTAVTRDYYGPGHHGYTMKKPRRSRTVSVTAP